MTQHNIYMDGDKDKGMHFVGHTTGYLHIILLSPIIEICQLTPGVYTIHHYKKRITD
uniref:Uncharacterized protein n=1 Tax=Arundo donax TaxID=35708 RepID=A0A0A9ATA7_ARUDO